MAQYINKSALVAEIERRRQELRPTNTHQMKVDEKMDRDVLMWLNALAWVKKLLNTLEVKEVDLDKDVRQIISLYYEGIKYYEDVIRKEREENGGSDLAIKIMDGVVDARELSIQYVIDKLKAQKGE